MSLEQLWAGWRAGYVASVSNPPETARGPGEASDSSEVAPEPSTCVFCRIIASDADDESRLVVRTASETIAIMNAYPYASGHLLVMPIRHVSEISELQPSESAELWSVTSEAITAIEAAYAPDGLNFGANLGRAAGAGIPRHLHLHVVPRWIGDTNFMTTVASVRVMPEALSVSWAKLRTNWPT